MPFFKNECLHWHIHCVCLCVCSVKCMCVFVFGVCLHECVRYCRNTRGQILEVGPGDCILVIRFILVTTSLA